MAISEIFTIILFSFSIAFILSETGFVSAADTVIYWEGTDPLTGEHVIGETLSSYYSSIPSDAQIISKAEYETFFNTPVSGGVANSGISETGKDNRRFDC